MSFHHSPIFLQSEDTVTEVSPDSDEYVLVLMSQCERKLKLLLEELQGKDLAAIMKEMEEEEVSRSFTMLLQHRSGMTYRLRFWIDIEKRLQR